MSFLALEDKTFLISGVANKKSVAYFSAKTLIEEGAKCLFSVQNESQIPQIQKLFPNAPVIICDVEKIEDLDRLPHEVNKHTDHLDGLLHSLAFANFSEGPKPFHQTNRSDYLQAAQISSFSLTEMCRVLNPLFTSNASVVTISISSTRATSYGYLGPIKAMLEASVAFLAKSFSEDSKIRVNAIGAGPLKTSASAGIPDYIDNYLFAEALTLRKAALETQEVANTVAFLLSNRSSGINASTIIVDAGMSSNYFDQTVVKRFNRD
ncbi:MAG: SDR family oxidoreductase [Bacteriovoracaceae bacterium]|nr:SDR family oxidoreductase [Bacteriovoracaceae bacterium]